MGANPVCRYNGRDFTTADMALLHTLLAIKPPLSRHALSREWCQRIGWLTPGGGLKDMSARLVMLAMQRDGRLTLPPPRRPQSRPKPIVFGPETDPPEQLQDCASGRSLLITASLDVVRPLQIIPVVSGTDASVRWNAYLARYHYLGYKVLSGDQLRYAVSDRTGRLLALLGFDAAAWKTAPRDAFIGWSSAQRRHNLHLVVNNSRFLILPWVRLPNLASHILSQIQQRLPHDWQQRYAYQPVLLETFCETPRFNGTVYRAANWTLVGLTQGRGRNDRDRQLTLPKKHIFIQPLRKDWQRILRQ